MKHIKLLTFLTIFLCLSLYKTKSFTKYLLKFNKKQENIDDLNIDQMS